ncbi:EAL domain, c-di-GMP-specific phosphodiesterase class I (or its enzymatically inactive variant) [Pseudobutyrivibrio sp. AR14]|uniref:EAL domain-containing protein n=1 Tax=Pseudobutyrivibrio sp. AR14 TaxID=1520804 RepID=UPI0008824A68|nr:EAL domain-containing protein [Pseudobutyrivibrio sp. AR14]SCY31514.1 EAL domain, c-di-GMP-specific phosphodiesterase class I (or its enzymatically inactive variant) [Pseudobutyrivibrio sp. AR14]
MNFNGYNVAAEEVGLIFALAVFYLTVVSRPRQTAVFSVVFYGQLLSIVNIVFHMASILLLDFSTSLQGIVFRLVVMLYYVSYLGILIHLFSYVHLLSVKQRENRDFLNILIIFLAGAYMVFVGGVYITDSYIKIVNDRYVFTNLFNCNIIFAIVNLLIVTVSVVANREAIPKIVMKYLYLFIPVELGLLGIQLLYPKYVFLNVTYVLPFILCYIIFHSILFDEVTGCQNKLAFESHFCTLKAKNKQCTIIYIKLPKLEIVQNIELMDVVKSKMSTEIHSLETKNKRAYMYQINDYTYAIIFERITDFETKDTIKYVKKRLDETMMTWEYSNRPEYKMVVIDHAENIENMNVLSSYSGFLFEHEKLKKSNCYEAVHQDYLDCMEIRRIERVIVDIRNKDNLDDPRVIVYVQPIFDVLNGGYKNAESLMRLDVEGEIILPDIFIPLAERVGCVHTLTRIILNKVCKKIYEIQDYYVFDAVSVNVSLSEFMDYNLHDELIEIIKRNGVPCEKIRLEMTESMTSDEFDAIAHNMEEFNNAGVHFYLDDFGTGYSNLERIVSLPFKTIKFDKTLLYKSEDDPMLMQLIQNMVDMFKNHGLVVLVEGVESEKQEMLSIKLGFEYIQGYRFAKPVPVETVQEFFEKKPKRLA